MPFEDEGSNPLNQRRFVTDDNVRRRLQSLDIINRPPLDNLEALPLEDPFGTREITEEFEPADEVIAIDGSRAEIPVGPERYSASVGFVEVAVVKVATDLLREQRKHQFVNDAVTSQSVEDHHVRLVMPSRNVVTEDLPQKEAWKKFTFENLRNKEIFGTSLFSAFKTILDWKGHLQDGQIVHPQCPVCGTKQEQLRSADEPDKCEFCGSTIYPTDRLRIYERLGKNQSNMTAINILMQIVEQLCTAIVLSHLVDQQSEAIDETVIMKDGPLAQFDTAAWIATGMQEWLDDLHNRESLPQPMIMGLHKEGDFGIFANEIRDKLPSTRIIPMSSSFIYDNVVIQREEDELFGESPKTYYGKNFIYKTKNDYVFPLTVPRRFNSDGTLRSAAKHYSELLRILSTLEDTALALYRDSVIPIHMAHDYATIPEGVGEKVLSELADQELFNASDFTH